MLGPTPIPPLSPLMPPSQALHLPMYLPLFLLLSSPLMSLSFLTSSRAQADSIGAGRLPGLGLGGAWGFVACLGMHYVAN